MDMSKHKVRLVDLSYSACNEGGILLENAGGQRRIRFKKNYYVFQDDILKIGQTTWKVVSGEGVKERTDMNYHGAADWVWFYKFKLTGNVSQKTLKLGSLHLCHNKKLCASCSSISIKSQHRSSSSSSSSSPCCKELNAKTQNLKTLIDKEGSSLTTCCNSSSSSSTERSLQPYPNMEIPLTGPRATGATTQARNLTAEAELKVYQLEENGKGFLRLQDVRGHAGITMASMDATSKRILQETRVCRTCWIGNTPLKMQVILRVPTTVHTVANTTHIPAKKLPILTTKEKKKQPKKQPKKTKREEIKAIETFWSHIQESPERIQELPKIIRQNNTRSGENRTRDEYVDNWTEILDTILQADIDFTSLKDLCMHVVDGKICARKFDNHSNEVPKFESIWRCLGKKFPDDDDYVTNTINTTDAKKYIALAKQFHLYQMKKNKTSKQDYIKAYNLIYKKKKGKKDNKKKEKKDKKGKKGKKDKKDKKDKKKDKKGKKDGEGELESELDDELTRRDRDYILPDDQSISQSVKLEPLEIEVNPLSLLEYMFDVNFDMFLDNDGDIILDSGGHARNSTNEDIHMWQDDQRRPKVSKDIVDVFRNNNHMFVLKKSARGGGWGLFAAKEFKKDEIVTLYNGYIGYSSSAGNECYCSTPFEMIDVDDLPNNSATMLDVAQRLRAGACKKCNMPGYSGHGLYTTTVKLGSEESGVDVDVDSSARTTDFKLIKYTGTEERYYHPWLFAHFINSGCNGKCETTCTCAKGNVNVLGAVLRADKKIEVGDELLWNYTYGDFQETYDTDTSNTKNNLWTHYTTFNELFQKNKLNKKAILEKGLGPNYEQYAPENWSYTVWRG